MTDEQVERRKAPRREADRLLERLTEEVQELRKELETHVRADEMVVQQLQTGHEALVAKFDTSHAANRTTLGNLASVNTEQLVLLKDLAAAKRVSIATARFVKALVGFAVAALGLFEIWRRL